MKASDTHIRSARKALALYRRIGTRLMQSLSGDEFQQCNFNGEGSNFPLSLYTVSDMLLVSNVSGRAKSGGAFWMEVAVSLDESAIPVVAVKSSLDEDVQVFVAENSDEEIFAEIERIFCAFLACDSMGNGG